MLAEVAQSHAAIQPRLRTLMKASTDVYDPASGRGDVLGYAIGAYHAFKIPAG